MPVTIIDMVYSIWHLHFVWGKDVHVKVFLFYQTHLISMDELMSSASILMFPLFPGDCLPSSLFDKSSLE